MFVLMIHRRNIGLRGQCSDKGTAIEVNVLVMFGI